MNHEGGYANNPRDTGGETYKGIARNFWPKWPGWQNIDLIKLNYGVEADKINKAGEQNAELQTHVLGFYKANFWDVLKLDEITNEALAVELFDTGVNCGTSIAALFLQRALNVSNKDGKEYPDMVLDSKIGPKTVSIANSHPRPNDVLKLLNVLQGARYVSICEHNTTQETFLRSWLSRVQF